MNESLNTYLTSVGLFDDGNDIIDLSKIKSKEMVSAYEYLKTFGFNLRKSKSIIRNGYMSSSGITVESIDELVEPTKVKVKLA